MSDTHTSPILDISYRDMVRDAAGQDYLDDMTAQCLDAATQFLAARPSDATAAGAQAHRLAGGTGTVGLPQLAQALRALENACLQGPVDTRVSWHACDEALARARLALDQDKAARTS